MRPTLQTITKLYMCGIILVKRKDRQPAYKAVLKRYRAQKGRGSEGFGYVAVKDGKVVSYQRTANEKDIIKLLEQEDAPEILFHHRFPTSTPNIAEAAHPILVSNPKNLAFSYLIAHNGVISNTEDLYDKHEKMGFKYNTLLKKGYTAVDSKKTYFEGYDWNDSESIAIETALALEHKVDQIGSRGAAAIIGYKLNGDEVVGRFFYRNNRNPLKYTNNQHMLTITSEGSGDEVSSLYVYALAEDGAYVAIPKLETPFAYQPYAGGSSRGDRFDYTNNYTLPAPKAGMTGFDRTLTEEERVERAAANAAALDMTEEEDGMPPTEHGFTRINELLISSIGTIQVMDDNSIWMEYADVLEARNELEEHIQAFDAFINDMDKVDDNIANKRLELDDKLKKMRDYEDRLEKEITRREALTRTIEDAIAMDRNARGEAETYADEMAAEHIRTTIGF